MSMNKISFIGNLTADPEMKEVGGATCLNFTVASDTRAKGSDGKTIANFYSCTAWRQAADTISKYMHKGDKIAIMGDLVNRPYRDRDGNQHYALSVTVTDFEFISSRKPEENAQPQKRGGYTPAYNETIPF